MRTTCLTFVALAAALLAACNAPQPEAPDEPPSPQAGATPTPAQRAATATAAEPRPPGSADSGQAATDEAPIGTDNPAWQDAAQRGVAFRALGQEPGWYVEIGGGQAPALHAVLDYGERTLDAAGVARLDGGQGYRGTTGDGTDIVVRVFEVPCFDGMSGHRFPARVELAVDGTTYHGCGAQL